MKIHRTTTLLVVDAIEPLLPLWRDALGYSALAEVPDGDRLGFALLAKDGQHLMFQTRASLAHDCPAVAERDPQSFLYIDVDSLDAGLAAMRDATLLLGPRTTFYGAREAFFVTASGHVVALAEPAPAAT